MTAPEPSGGVHFPGADPSGRPTAPFSGEPPPRPFGRRLLKYGLIAAAIVFGVAVLLNFLDPIIEDVYQNAVSASGSEAVGVQTGRVVVEEYGFALELPDGWEAADFTTSDAEELFRTAHERFGIDIGADVSEFLATGTVLLAADRDPDHIGENGVRPNLSLLVAPSGGAPIGEISAVVMQGAEEGANEAGVDLLDEVEEIIQLPAGEAAHLSYEVKLPGIPRLHQDVYLIIADGKVYDLAIGRAASQVDRADEIRTIAESFEFLP